MQKYEIRLIKNNEKNNCVALVITTIIMPTANWLDNKYLIFAVLLIVYLFIFLFFFL